MEFLSPSRPTNGAGSPQYPHFDPVGVLPGISIRPTIKSGYRLSLFLMIDREHRSSEFFCYRSTLQEALLVVDHYFADPEGIMKSAFNWPGVREKRLVDEDCGF